LEDYEPEDENFLTIVNLEAEQWTHL
jgi:hypothetical protein